MRTVKYRAVLWGLCYKLGLDPAKELLVDQAEAFTSYINEWVRRVWDAADYYEWTLTEDRIPDTNHIVPYERSVLVDPPVGDGPSLPKPIDPMGRIFKVYLVDPATTWMPVDTPFRLRPEGVHVGFEHGPVVWIKFAVVAPVFTSQVWRSDVTYLLDQLTYSPVT